MSTQPATTRRKETEPRHKRQPGDRCVDCNKPMRPTGTLIKDYPGTTNYHSKGRCGPCHKASIPRTVTPFVPGSPCVTCDRPMRARGTVLKNHPGTVVHHSNQICYNCINGAFDHAPSRGTVAVVFPPRPEGLEAADDRNYTYTNSYIQARRGRGIPAQGLPLHIWIHRNRVAA